MKIYLTAARDFVIMGLLISIIGAWCAVIGG